jgi:5'-nucleotidase
VKWATAEHHAPKIIRKLLKAGWPKGVLINVNFPDVIAESVTGVEVVRQGQRDLTDLVLDHRIDARGVPYYWIGFRRQKSKSKRQSDLGATENGAIAITPLQLDLTQGATLKALKSALK